MTQEASGEQIYYSLLRSHDPSQPAVRQAALCARRYADLASRCLAALGEESASTINLSGPALGALLENCDLDRFASLLRLALAAEVQALRKDFLVALFAWLDYKSTPACGLPQPVQVWFADHPGAAPRLYAPCAQAAPPAPFALAEEPPIADWLRFSRPRPAHVLAHYDGHGVTMAALSLRYLHSLQVPTDCAISFEWTGDLGKLWKRAVTRAVASPEDYSTVVMVDCPVHSRKPEHTLKALRKVAEQSERRLLLIDHHSDTVDLAAQLAGLPGVQLVLTDIPSCGLFGKLSSESEALMFTGALSDKLPGLPEQGEARQSCEAAAAALHRWCLHFSPTPPELKAEGSFPFVPLIKALAEGAPCTEETITRELGALPAEDEIALPNYSMVGAVSVATSRLNAPGRAWYAILERMMSADGTSYAIAARLLNGHRANLLLLTHWEDIHVPPIKSFIPAEYLSHCLGHATAVWIDLEAPHASAFLLRVINAANAHFALDADAAAAVYAVQQNIYEAPPVQAEPLDKDED